MLTKPFYTIDIAGFGDSHGVEVDSCTTVLITLQKIHSDHAAHGEVKLTEFNQQGEEEAPVISVETKKFVLRGNSRAQSQASSFTSCYIDHQAICQ